MTKDREQLGLQVLHILLSQSDCDVCVEDNDGRQPLLWAASAGSAKAVLALARAGASVQASDKDGLTALHCAASRGHTNCLDTLLTLCGAQPDVIDSNGCTALHYAVTLGHADATSLLLSHSSDPNRQDRRGRTPAHCGCAKGQIETVRLLGKHGANLWLRNARGDLPLHEAASSGRRDLLTWLLDQRPSQVNARNNDGRSALHLAALNDNSDMCKILIDAGAYINPVLRTSKNLLMTPLDCAMQRGFRSTAKYLQMHGGLPASRLNLRPGGPEISTNFSVSSSLHVRDDVTLLGASSTESDIDEKKDTRPKRRTIRKRLAYRYSKTKESVTDEDMKTRAKERLANRDKSSDKPDKQTDHETKSKVEHKESRDSNKSDKDNNKISSEEDANKQRQTEIKSPKEKSRQRPKSAKKREKKSSTEITEPITVEGKVVSEKEHENGHINVEKDEDLKNKSDEEQSKTLLVEASIHEPPKIDPLEIKEEKPKETIKETKITKIEDTSITTTVEISETGKENKDLLDKEIIIEQKITIGSPRQQQTPKEEVKLEEKSPKTVETPIKIEEKVEEVTQEVQKEEKNFESLEKSEGTKSEDTIIENGKVDQPKSPKKEEESKQEEETKQEAETVEITKETTAELEKITPDEKIQEETENNSKETNKDDEKVTPDINKEEKSEELVQSPKEYEEITPQEETKENVEPPKEETKKTSEINIDLSLKKFEESADLTDSTTDTKTHIQKQKRYKKRLKTIKDETETRLSPSDQSSSEDNHKKGHKSFQIIDEEPSFQILDEDLSKKTPRRQHLSPKTPDTLIIRSRSVSREKGGSSCETHISLPLLPEKSRSESNLSAPNLSMFSDVEQKTDSELEDVISSGSRKKKLKRRSKVRMGSKSAGSDYESSVLIDSGFEPSPRSSRIPKRKVMSDRSVNMTSVTQSIQTNIRRYHMERKIFQHLLDLKRLQIRSGQTNEAVLVKRAIESYNSSIASTVGGGRYSKKDFTYRSFEQFLYHCLKMLQKGVAESSKMTVDNPLLCTQSTHRCMHATHAYTGIPCAAYIPKMNHHTIPKIGFSTPKTQSGFLPQINNKGKAVTLELCHGNDKQVISLPADRLDQNKRYYVTFTVKGQESQLTSGQGSATHRHAKSV